MPERSHFACVVGAPRCGTTSLSAFLKEHPQVCFSSVKEPHFFSQHDFTRRTTEELQEIVRCDYLARYFADRLPDHSLLAEGSVSYLYVPKQMEPILQLWPDAKFIIAVRDPLQMLPSLHQRLLYMGDETTEDFGQAWAMIPERAQGRNIPQTCVDPRLLRYDELGRLGTYVERFFQLVGRERCFVAVFDDLVSAPAAMYQQMLDFLGLEPHERDDYAPRRTARSYRIGWLQRLLKRPPMVTRAVVAGEKYRQRIKPLDGGKPDPALIRATLAARQKLLKWNKASPPPIRLSLELRAAIRERLAGEIDRLSCLIERDLGHWLDRASPPVRSRDAERIRIGT